MSGPEADAFEMCEVVGRAELDRHPVWATWGDPGDRALVLGYGVAAEQLDRALARFDDCGPSLLFPVLAEGPLPDKAGLVVSARFETAGGQSVPGYVLEPHAFALFVGEREIAFNRTLVRQAARSATSLCEALGEAESALFPLRFETGRERADGSLLGGEITPFW